jgi:hypothetical protein
MAGFSLSRKCEKIVLRRNPQAPQPIATSKSVTGADSFSWRAAALGLEQAGSKFKRLDEVRFETAGWRRALSIHPHCSRAALDKR